jgi:hypothetical protein
LRVGVRPGGSKPPIDKRVSYLDFSMRRQAAAGIGFTVAAIALALLFAAGIRLSVSASIVIFALTLGAAAVFLRTPTIPLLSLYVLGLYSLPFINLVEHALHPPEYFLSQTSIWGLAPNEYERDPDIIQALGMVGAIGAAALAAGMFVAAWLLPTTPAPPPVRPPVRPRLSWLAFVGLLVGALALSWMQAPTATIFDVAYPTGSSPLTLCGINFNAARMVTAVFVVAGAVDVLFESGRRRLLKLALWGTAVVIVVLWFQFLRGEREAIAIFPAAAALATFDPSFLRALRRPWVWIGLVCFAFVILIGGQLVGTIRSAVAAPRPTGIVETCPLARLSSNANPGTPSPEPSAAAVVAPGDAPEVQPASRVVDAIANNRATLGTGTWSAVLLSPLSVVGDYERGLLQPRLGATYVDYVLSLPPGFVTQALHIERPIEATHGPAWEMRFGIGGTHLLVVPFVNFLAPGVAVVLMLIGIVVGATEKQARLRPTWASIFWYGTMVVAVPRWVWYGDLYLVRAAMAFASVLAVVWLLERVHALRSKRRTRPPSSFASSP